MTDLPKISIITPTFNSEGCIRETIESVQQQTYKNWEHIIIDGASKDNTLQIIQEYEHIVLISEPDKGVYDAMNKGIKLATGDYIYFLGSDDVLYSEKVLKEIFNGESKEDLVYGNVKFKYNGQIYSGESSIARLVKQQISICHQACFYSKRVFEEIGLFNVRYFVHADYDLNVKCFENEKIAVRYIDKIIALYNEKGISSVKSNADKFHDDLALHYINHYSDPLSVVREIKALTKEIESLKQINNRVSNLLLYRIAKKGVSILKQLKFR